MTTEQREQQAGQFLAYHRKRGGAFEDDFGAWAASKDFVPKDAFLIRGLAHLELVAQGRAVFTELDPAGHGHSLLLQRPARLP